MLAEIVNKNQWLLNLSFVARPPVLRRWPRYSVPHSIRNDWNGKTSVVAYFIPLPEPLDVPHLYEMPIAQVLDPRDRSPSVSLGKRQGVEHVFRTLVRFHQSERKLPDVAVAAVMDALGGKEQRIEQGGRRPFHRPRSITVAEVWGPLALGDADGLTTGFDNALTVLRSIQRSHHIVTTRPISLVVRKSLPAVLPVMISSGEVFATPSMSMFLVNQDEQYRSSYRGTEMDEDGLRNLGQAFSEFSPNLFTGFSDLRREGRLSYERGENLSAIILAGAAAEALLVEIMLLMMWEEDLDCAHVANVLDIKDTVTKKVNSQFASRLGGQWNLKQPGPIRDWRTNLADPRNRAVHAGVTPDDETIQTAFESLEALERYVGDRIAINMRKYPATTQLFLGVGGLARRRKLAVFQQTITEDNSYLPPFPGQYFRRWREEVDRIREGRNEGSEKNAELFLVTYPNGQHRWFVQDTTNGLAAQTRPPVLDEKTALQASKLTSQPPPVPMSTFFHRHRVTINGPLNWQPIGELNPAHSYRRWQVCLIPPAQLS